VRSSPGGSAALLRRDKARIGHSFWCSSPILRRTSRAAPSSGGGRMADGDVRLWAWASLATTPSRRCAHQKSSRMMPGAQVVPQVRPVRRSLPGTPDEGEGPGASPAVGANGSAPGDRRAPGAVAARGRRRLHRRRGPLPLNQGVVALSSEANIGSAGVHCVGRTDFVHDLGQQLNKALEQSLGCRAGKRRSSLTYGHWAPRSSSDLFGRSAPLGAGSYRIVRLFERFRGVLSRSIELEDGREVCPQRRGALGRSSTLRWRARLMPIEFTGLKNADREGPPRAPRP